MYWDLPVALKDNLAFLVNIWTIGNDKCFPCHGLPHTGTEWVSLVFRHIKCSFTSFHLFDKSLIWEMLSASVISWELCTKLFFNLDVLLGGFPFNVPEFTTLWHWTCCCDTWKTLSSSSFSGSVLVFLYSVIVLWCFCAFFVFSKFWNLS